MESLTVQFKPNNFKADQPIDKIARDYFLEWATEGGLPEAFNPALNAEHGMHVILTGSGTNMLEFSVEKLPPKRKR